VKKQKARGPCGAPGLRELFCERIARRSPPRRARTCAPREARSGRRGAEAPGTHRSCRENVVS